MVYYVLYQDVILDKNLYNIKRHSNSKHINHKYVKLESQSRSDMVDKLKNIYQQ